MKDEKEIMAMSQEDVEKDLATSYFYCVYDTLSKAFGPVQEFTNDDVALRGFRKSFKDVSDWVGDFNLYKLGYRIGSAGQSKVLQADLSNYFHYYTSPKLVCVGKDLLKDTE